MANKSNQADNRAVLIGSVVAAAALGAYFMGTASGKKQSKKIKGWMVRMKGDVMDRLEDMKEVTEPVYQGVVDTVADAQAAAGKIPKNEIMALAMDLKRQWNTIQRLTGRKAGSRSARSTTRKTSRSTSGSKKRSAKKSSSSRSGKRSGR